MVKQLKTQKKQQIIEQQNISDSDNDLDSEAEQDPSELEEKKIKKALSNMPFEMLLKIKQQEKIAQQQQQKQQKQYQQQTQHDNEFENEKQQLIIKQRTDKSAPIERDARRTISKYKQVISQKKPQGRDPRFDHLSGKLRWGLFQKSYDFIKGMKKNEISVLQRQIKKTKDIELKERLREVLSSTKDDFAKNKIVEKNKQLKRDLWNKNLTPNRTLVKKEEMKMKFNELQKKGKLDQFIQLKKKKKMQKLERAMELIK